MTYEDLQPYSATPEGLDELIADVIGLRDYAGDPEAAHSEEDKIRHRVLLTIASGRLGRKGAQEFARVALGTSKIDFARWMA